MAGVELYRDCQGAARAQEVAEHCNANSVLFRVIDDTIAMSPPLVVEPSDIDVIVTTLCRAIHAVD